MAGERAAVQLPGGLWRDDRRQREVVLRALEEREELELDSLAPGHTPAERTTRLLALCVERIGSMAPVGEDEIRALTVGDREALILHLRRLTCGERMPCVLDCPGEGCEERLELDLAVADLLVDPYPVSGPIHTAVVGGRKLRFRLPTGADQERAAETARRDVKRAAGELTEACVLENEPGTEDLADELGARMEEIDPQAQVTLALICPECRRSAAVAFDAASYLFGELGQRARRLEQEVHVLALHYNWSEGEALALGRRRRRYLALLAAEGSGAVS